MAKILHTEASMGWGGQEIRILNEAIGMMTRGHLLSIAAPRASNIFRRAQEAGIKMYPIEFNKKNPLSFMRMRSILAQERPDIVNTHSSSDSWVASCVTKLFNARIKIIRTRHLSTPISKSRLSRILYERLPDAVMTTGEEIRKRMITINQFNGSKIFSVPTGVDIARFGAEAVRPAIQKKAFTVGMVGVLRSWKGHMYLLRAIPLILEQIPDARFIIAGEGPQRQNIERLTHTLSLAHCVSLLGHREDIPEILASMDVVVHPSYANEGVPQTLLQALAMKRPVVASNAGAIKEVIVDGQTGFLIEPKNSVQLAEKIVELFRNPALRERFGLNGRALVEQEYSFEGMLDKIELLYKRLLHNADI